MRQTLKLLMLIFLLFLISNGRIAETLSSRNEENSVNLLNDPRLYFSSRQRCFSTSELLSNDAHFDKSDNENTEDSPIRRHDLARCPANAAESLHDLNSSLDPASSDLSLLLNITDSKNKTNEQPDASPEFNVHRLEDEEKVFDAPDSQQQPTTQKPDQSEEALEGKTEKQTPPPIATFEEWTKEKLLSKEKKPPIKEVPQQVVNGNGAPAADQKPPTLNGQQNNGNTGTGQEQTATIAPTAKPLPNVQEPNVQQPPILNDITSSSNTIPAPQIAKRNYASKECGAKVLLANDEAEHRNAVLNDKERDEYMRNPCERAQQKFLIIELCETIQPNFLELANFELFSSNPKDIRLSVSERYPTVEWTTVGQFVAADTREMQSFQFTSPGIYAKFIKLDLLSHYGKEHYCTLTTLRIGGISMVDEYEEEANSMNSAGSTILAPPVEQQPTGTINQPPIDQQVEAPVKPIEEVQKVDPANESEETKPKNKPFVLEKVVGIVENLGQIKDVVGKTIFGNRSRQKMTGIISPNSCTNFCPLIDYNIECPVKCHYFNLIELPTKKQQEEILPSKIFSTSTRTQAQNLFLQAILRLSQCPTVVVEPKRQEPELKPVESPKEEPKHEQNVEQKQQDQKVEHQKQQDQKVEEQKAHPPSQQPAQNQQFQLPKVPNSLPGTVSTHKESVFMKLNKRLSALELNMSLSSEYLSELSRRYVAQQDGYNKQHERDLRILEEMVSRLGDTLKSGWINEINQLRTDLKDLAQEMNHIKKTVPASFDSSSTSSLSLIDRSDRPYEDSCYNMLPPAEEVELPERHDTSWTNEQIVAVVTLSNLSAFTLFACVYLLYKILVRRNRFNANDLTQEEIRALVQREIEFLRKSMPKEAGQVHDIQLDLTNQTTKDNGHAFTQSKRSKRKQRQANIQSVASSTLSLPSTVATTSTSALDTMSSSQSLSDIDQIETTKTMPILMNLLSERSQLSNQERSASANLPLNITANLKEAISQQLSPPWQTVQAKRKLSDKTLKVPPPTRNNTKIKVN